MIVLIDNYDSFTHNLFQYMSEMTSEEVRVVRNDRITVSEIERLAPSRIVVSPGPGRPEEAGVSVAAIQHFAGKVPILGVCLGHQAIGYAFGARIIQARRIVHGKAEPIATDGRGIFRSIPTPAVFTRYHSLAIDFATVPEGFEVTATAEDGEIMGVRHKEHVIEGVQFHPESIASEAGKQLLRNFLNYRREPFVSKAVLGSLIEGATLSRDEAANFMEELTEGNLTPTQIAGFLVSIAARGPRPEEIAGCASVLQRKRTPISIDRPVLDTCGTGGDGLGTFNISSLSALAAAACGATVAKHGNRAVSSKSGSADFYRALGIAVDLPPAYTERLIGEHNFGFLFAPIYHGAMRHAAVPRRELGVKTIMNLLGPLVNPAGAAYQLIGVYAPEYVPIVAEAAHMLGIRKAMVVHGLDGIDEISVSARTRAVTIGEDGTLEESEVDPAALGITGHSIADLTGGDAEENAAIAREILDGKGSAAIRDAVTINAAAALTVYGVANDLADGVARVRSAFDDGSLKRFVEKIVAVSQQLAEEAKRAAAEGAA
ncbi:MAG: bifunctional anthranilate synthase component II/anthranilate phosphoribosyltransferase [Spirochaetota bacterium]